MKKHALLISIPVLLLTRALLSGDSLTVQLTGLSVNDGTDYVLPYELTINGLQTGAICYSALYQISMDQSWQANEYDLSQVLTPGTGMFNGPDAAGQYETVPYLASQWYTGAIAPGDTSDEIALQYAIWDVFEPGAFTVPGNSLVAGLLDPDGDGLATPSELQNFVSSGDINDYTFLEPVANTQPEPQPFVLYTPGNHENPTTPEPGSWLLLVIGSMLIGVAKIRFVRVE